MLSLDGSPHVPFWSTQYSTGVSSGPSLAHPIALPVGPGDCDPRRRGDLVPASYAENAVALAPTRVQRLRFDRCNAAGAEWPRSPAGL